MKPASDPLYFAEPRLWRRWLQDHHHTARELWVGFHKKSSGKRSISWPQAVDEALCFGWIDGVRKNVDESRYKIRFVPRKPGGIWSNINVKRVAELSSLGLMRPAGLAVFRKRNQENSGVYSYEQRNSARLGPDLEKKLKANKRASDFFQSQPPWYRKAATWWVVSAKQEQTRLRRFMKLLEDSGNGRTIPPLTRKRIFT